ncbi:MAG: TetR/AcrR family transcriptional regulator [Nostocoides sp.]
MTDTKTLLKEAAIRTLREDGLAGASARTIAGRAGVNQALIFYHFDTVNELLEVASNDAVDAAVAHYCEAFAGTASLTDLLGLGREVRGRERANGNVAVMAQLMSGAQGNEVLSRATRYAMARWTAEIERVLRRVVGTGPMAGLVDLTGLAHLVSAGFIGLELYAGADQEGADRALATLGDLARLTETLDSVGPVAARVIRSAARRKGGSGS